MIRFFRAFLWMRWRLWINSLRGGGDAVARLARWAQAFVGVVVPIMFVPVALVLGALALFAGKYLGTPGTDSNVTVITVRIVLGFVTINMLIAPLIRSIHGSTTGRSRFLLLPIQRSTLHLCETASGLSDPWLFLIVLPLLMLPVGWSMSGSVTAGLLTLTAGLILILTLTTLGALAVFLAHLLLRNQQRAELIAMAAIMVIMLVSFLPMVVEAMDVQDEQAREELQERVREQRVSLIKAAGPFTWVIPSELYAKTLVRAHDGRIAAGLVPLGVMALLGTTIFLSSARVYRRLLDSPESSSPRRGRGGALAFRQRSLPGLGHAASTVAWVTARVAMRTVKGKLAVVTTPIVVGVLSLVLSRQWAGIDFAGMHVGAFSVGLLIAVVLPLLSFQPILLNLYAVDRAGLTLQYLVPATDQDLVRGKIAGGALLTTMATVPGLILVPLITRQGSLAFWLAMLLGSIASYLVLGPVFAMLSTLFPKAADLNSLGSQGNASNLAVLVAMFLTPAMLVPIVILVLVGQLFGGLYLSVVLVAVWVAVAAALSFPLTQLATSLLARRRENVAMVAQGR